MKILFVISDIEGAALPVKYLGWPLVVKRRAVEIELTPEQMEKLSIQKLGTSLGQDILETIESISQKLEIL
jgi:hypothetical protein